jgi:hypothetical protein
MRTGILCHGRHVLANNWELHQWGDQEKNLLGQILKTLILSYQERPEVVIFGTGASEKDGLKESEYTLKYMFDNFEKVAKFNQFNNIDLGFLKDYMIHHSVPEKKSQNTFEEIKYAGEIFLDYNIEKVIIVSNPDHISRCMQMAHQVYQQTKLKSLENLFASQSEIGYDGTNNLTSKIIEMPHRGDDVSPNILKPIGEYFKLPLEKKRKFTQLITNFFSSSNKKKKPLPNTPLGYNDFLSKIMNEVGLEHGYDLFTEGEYLGHRIFTKESMKKNPFIKRVFHLNQWGRLYSVNTIAEFEEEPEFNAMEGCFSDETARINIINENYVKELEKITRQIVEYSTKRNKGIPYIDQKEPIVLSVT